MNYANYHLFRAIQKALGDFRNFNATDIGHQIETSEGLFICLEKPNEFQLFDQRFWKFQQVEDAYGESLVDGPIVTVQVRRTWTKA